MAKAFINDENLTDIADAIRETLDESRQYLPSEMANAIQSIPIMAQLNRKKYFQSVPAGAASGYATIEKVEGNTVKFNQLVDSGTTSVTIPSGHKYLSLNNGTKTLATSDGTAISVTGGSDNVFDLTQMFGAGNEPTTVADFEAWREQNGLPSVAGYNAGELLSCKMHSVKSVGFNQWDEEIVTGGYYDNNGTWKSLADIISDANGIRVFPDTNYYVHLGNTGSGMAVTEWDASGNFIRRITSVQNTTITTSSNAHTLHLNAYANYGSIYNHDICINLSDPVKNGTYEPYQSDSADIDVTTITGINTSTNVREVMFSDGMNSTADGDMDVIDLTSDTAERATFVLPSGYTELEYIRSDGSAYINTNITPTSHTSYEIIVKCDTGAGNVNIFGAANGNDGDGANALYTLNSYSDTKFEIKFAVSPQWYRVTDDATAKNTLYMSATEFKVNGVVMLTNSLTIPDTGNQPFFLFQRWRPTITSTNNKVQIYGLKIWESGVLVQWLIPCKNSSNVVGMYDVVSGTFIGNAGSGSLDAGTAVVKNVYTLESPIEFTDLQDANGNPLNPRYKVEQGGTEQVLPVNTSTPTTVAPTLSTIYKKNA